MSAGNAYSSWHLVPSPFLGLAYAPIVETSFHELVSFLDFSPLIPLGTFSVLMLQMFVILTMSLWHKVQITLELGIICKSMIISVPWGKALLIYTLQQFVVYLQAFASNTGMPQLFKVGINLQILIKITKYVIPFKLTLLCATQCIRITLIPNFPATSRQQQSETTKVCETLCSWCQQR